MTKEVILGAVRHALTFGGGFLVSSNWLTGSDMDAFVGAIITIAGVVWSIIQKRSTANALKALPVEQPQA